LSRRWISSCRRAVRVIVSAPPDDAVVPGEGRDDNLADIMR
jgi:hypothetical protein